MRPEVQIVAFVINQLEWQHNAPSLPRSFFKRNAPRTRSSIPICVLESALARALCFRPAGQAQILFVREATFPQ